MPCLNPNFASHQISDLPARELLPGDIVEIHTGDRVPADVRIVQVCLGSAKHTAAGMVHSCSTAQL